MGGWLAGWSTYRLIIETSNNCLLLLITDVDDIVFSINSITIIIECHLTGLSTDVSCLQIVENSLSCTIMGV